MDNIDRFLYIGFFVLKFYILSKLLWEVAMTITNPRRLLRERKGLSEVVTTLILLAFGVLLATTVIVYTNGVTRARMKSTVGESLRFYKPHIWAEEKTGNESKAVIAFKLYNIGGKSTSVEYIDVRGSEVDWNNVYYYTVPQNTTIYRDLNRTDYDSLTGSSVVIDSRTYTQALEKLSARSGGMVIVYAKSPPVIHKDNIGQPVTLALSTANANYITEIVVESAE
jgi:flagellin-like protein